MASTPGAREPRLIGRAVLFSRAERIEARARRSYLLKKYPATVKHLEQLLHEVGENPHTLAMLALCCHRSGRNDRALTYAERALEVDSAHLTALRAMSSALAGAGRDEEACGYAKHGLDALAREAPEAAPRGWKGWFASRRASTPSREEEEWAEWARSLLARHGRPGTGEGGRAPPGFDPAR